MAPAQSNRDVPAVTVRLTVRLTLFSITVLDAEPLLLDVCVKWVVQKRLSEWLLFVGQRKKVKFR
jgi:hypothetical protein